MLPALLILAPRGLPQSIRQLEKPGGRIGVHAFHGYFLKGVLVVAKRRYYTKSGLTGLMARVSVKGLTAIDKRSAGAKALLRWKAELLRDLGGEEGLSAQRKTLVELSCRLRLYLDHIDAYLMTQPTLVRKRTRTLLPVVHQRQQLSDALAKLLRDLGLERKAVPVKSIREYVSELEAVRPGVRDEDEPDNLGCDDGSEDSGVAVSEADGEGHLDGVEDISERPVRVADDRGGEERVSEVYGPK
jgi:hypothetical protein